MTISELEQSFSRLAIGSTLLDMPREVLASVTSFLPTAQNRHLLLTVVCRGLRGRRHEIIRHLSLAALNEYVTALLNKGSDYQWDRFMAQLSHSYPHPLTLRVGKYVERLPALQQKFPNIQSILLDWDFPVVRLCQLRFSPALENLKFHNPNQHTRMLSHCSSVDADQENGVMLTFLAESSLQEDVSKAKTLVAKAIQLMPNYKQATLVLAKIEEANRERAVVAFYDSGELKKGHELIRLLAKRQNGSLHFLVPLIRTMVKSNPKRAFDILSVVEKESTLPGPFAAYLGDLLFRAPPGVPKNMERAKALLEKAISVGNLSMPPDAYKICRISLRQLKS